MKNNFLTKVLFLFVGLAIISCEKETVVEGQVTAEDVAKVKAALTVGEWKITYYFDDTDETSDYFGYVLTFNADGVLSANNGTIATTGSWSIEDASEKSGDDSSSDDDVDFNIFFTNPDIFEELTEDWDIVSYSDSKVELKDVSGGDGTTDFLTLEKI